MELEEVIKSRFSSRKFEDKDIEKEKLDKIIEAGRLAPTAKNYQPQKILIIKSKEGLEKISKVSPCVYGAKCVMMVFYDEDIVCKLPNGINTGAEDCSIVTAQMMLEATNLGLRTCWINMFDPVKLKMEFDYPKSWVPVCMLDIGYSNAKPNQTLHYSRKSREEMFKEV